MITRIINKPTAGQYPKWASGYIDQTKDGDVFPQLEKGLKDVLDYVEQLTDAQLLHSYAEGKWTIKEMIVHLMDAERVFTYRALAAARGDKTALPGFDHNGYVPQSQANQRSKESLMQEYTALRKASIQFFSYLTDEAFDNIGTASGHPCSAKAMIYMIAGHERHHLKILLEKYQQ